VADKATVPIYYESRVAKLGLNASEIPKIDEEFEEITEGEEESRKQKRKTKWAALEALVGNPKLHRSHRGRSREALRARPRSDGR
jgi:type I restriction enzyme R subunit